MKPYAIFLCWKHNMLPQLLQSIMKRFVQKVSIHESLPQKTLSRVFSEDYDDDEKAVFDPRGPVRKRWNRIFFAACFISSFIDPLFLLLPRAREEELCLDVPKHMETALMVIRTIIDVFYLIHIFFQFRTAYAAPSSRVFGRGELVLDPSKIASRYLQKRFWFDALAALPIPQVVICIVIPSLRGSPDDDTRNIVRVCILIQYLLRLFLMVPLSKKINQATGIVFEAAWAGAAFNLMLYMLASHFLGCLWYLLAFQRQEDCWREVCALEDVDCRYSYLYCSAAEDPGRVSWLRSTNITELCSPDNGFFEFGIHGDALVSAVTSTGFFKKFFYCLWWAQRNMNSLGQEFSTSTYPGEIAYAITLGILALILFTLLIGNMQIYLQSTITRLEQWRIWKTDTERWMHHRQLPGGLRESVRKHNQSKWCRTRGVDEEAIIKSLPVDLQRVIKRHLCLDLVRKVRLFDMMDEHMLDAICEKLKPCLHEQSARLVREGDPVKEMLFIVRGRLDSYTTDGGRIDFFNSSLIGPGDFCGEELINWALDPQSTSILPSSTRTVIGISEVEAFSLEAEDLIFVASQFRRQFSKQVRQVFRFHSHHWRKWGALCIQAAWFRFKKRKEEAELKRMKTVGKSSSPRLLRLATNFTMYSRKLAATSRRGGQKPEDPDFAVEK